MGKHELIRQKHPRHAFSLLEMVAAAALMTSILVPALSVMRDAMAKSRDMNRRNVLSLYAAHYIELYAGLAANNWPLASNTSTLLFIGTPNGYGNIRAMVSLSDDPANGGLTNQLSHVQITVFDDVNGNSSLDANEPNVKYRTKVAKLKSYENEAY